MKCLEKYLDRNTQWPINGILYSKIFLGRHNLGYGLDMWLRFGKQEMPVALFGETPVKKYTCKTKRWKENKVVLKVDRLTFWRRNYFFLILAHPVYKMWIIQELNTLELWNKLHFEEEKKRRVYTMFQIFIIYICWINI